MPSIAELTHQSSIIFSGTVEKLGGSTVPVLKSEKTYAIVRVVRGFFVDHALGNLSGRLITVVPVAGGLREGEKAVFFALSLIHGGGIAVREIAHVEISQEREVETAVAQLPELHLADRLNSAEIVASGEVVEITAVPRQTPGKDYPHWQRATVRVQASLKGKAEEDIVVYFPAGDSREWFHAPRLSRGQRAIFLVRRDPKAKSWFGRELAATAMTALDPADVQHESQLGQVRTLLAQANSREGGVR